MSKTIAIKSERLLFREIDLSDTDYIVEWRSDPEVYKYFKNPVEITNEQHIDWFQNHYLTDDSRIDLMALDANDDRVGVFGLIIDGNSAEISYIVAPNQQHKGFATEGVLRLIKYAIDKYNVSRITAEIKLNNIPSIKLIEKLGFRQLKTHDDFVTYEFIVVRQLFFRVDGNSEIGLGHVMRCISIAEAAKDYGYNSIFILADDSCLELVSSYGFEGIVLDSDWRDLGVEVDKMRALITQRHIYCLFVDSYNVSNNYFTSLPCKKFYIDDLGDNVLSVDALVCYAIYSDDLKLSEHYENTELLLGPDYVPLRKEFKQLPTKSINQNIQNILIMSGGTNPNNISGKIAEFLAKTTDYMITIVGDALVNYPKITVVKETQNIKTLMESADLAISAGGTTLYELCACGTPAISYSIADNQLFNVEKFDKGGIIKYSGKADDPNLMKIIASLLNEYSFDFRLEVSQKMQKLIDGNGASKIAKKMIEYS